MSDDNLKGCRDQAVGHLSLRGLEPGIFNQYRAIPYDLPAWPDDEFLAELILCDALTQEGVAAWPGDATCIVSDIVRSYHRKAESQSAALAAKDAEIARLRTMVSRHGAHDDNCESWIKQGGTFRLCDCGFSRALTPPGAEAETAREAAEIIARGLWHAALEKAETPENEAVLICGDDWHQYLPEATALLAAKDAEIANLKERLNKWEPVTFQREGNI